MRQEIGGVALAAMVAAGGVSLHAQPRPGAVRPESAEAGALVASGMDRSATFRDLAAALELTDVVVYVRFSRCALRVPACLNWVASSAGSRRLLIRVDQFDRSPDEVTALLAHELQHASEVASAPEVTDLASFERLFAARGWKQAAGFETAQARDVTKTVAAELIDAGRQEPGLRRRRQRPRPSALLDDDGLLVGRDRHVLVARRSHGQG